jgi:hypothetical protein
VSRRLQELGGRGLASPPPPPGASTGYLQPFLEAEARGPAAALPDPADTAAAHCVKVGQVLVSITSALWRTGRYGSGCTHCVKISHVLGGMVLWGMGRYGVAGM